MKKQIEVDKWAEIGKLSGFTREAIDEVIKSVVSF